jgi:hypothetical protein
MKVYYHILESWSDEIGYQGYFENREEAEKRKYELQEMFPKSYFYIETSNNKREPNNVTR